MNRQRVLTLGLTNLGGGLGRVTDSCSKLPLAPKKATVNRLFVQREIRTKSFSV